MYVCKYVCMYVRVYIYIYIYILNIATGGSRQKTAMASCQTSIVWVAPLVERYLSNTTSFA